MVISTNLVLQCRFTIKETRLTFMTNDSLKLTILCNDSLFKTAFYFGKEFLYG